jgi:hypothetical protein
MARQFLKERAHISEMPKSADATTFDAKPLKTGEGWHIVVTYPRRMQQHIPGFCDEAETREWISGKGRQTWPRFGVTAEVAAGCVKRRS